MTYKNSYFVLTLSTPADVFSPFHATIAIVDLRAEYIELLRELRASGDGEKGIPQFWLGHRALWRRWKSYKPRTEQERFLLIYMSAAMVAPDELLVEQPEPTIRDTPIPADISVLLEAMPILPEEYVE